MEVLMTLGIHDSEKNPVEGSTKGPEEGSSKDFSKDTMQDAEIGAAKARAKD